MTRHLGRLARELRPDSLDPRPRCFRPSRRRPRRTAWSSTTVSTSPSGPWSTRPPLQALVDSPLSRLNLTIDSPTARPASCTRPTKSAATLLAGCAADTAAPVALAGHASAACPLFCARVGSANHGRTWLASCGAAATTPEAICSAAPHARCNARMQSRCAISTCGPVHDRGVHAQRTRDEGFRTAWVTEERVPEATGNMTAIVISGHLRDACQNHTHLNKMLHDCETHRKPCQLFLCTWSLTYPEQTHHQANGQPTPSWECIHRLMRDLNPTSVIVDSQTPISNQKWGRSLVNTDGYQYAIDSLNRCNDLSTRRVFHATYRLRFEEAYAPSAEIWNYQVTNNTIRTYASHACKANIDNVFWGPAQSMTRLLNTWSINLPKYSRSPIAADNPERSMCLAATHSSLRVVPYKK